MNINATRLSILVTVLVLTSPVRAQDAPPWERMDYGPFLSTAVGLRGSFTPVYKGLVVQLRTPDGELTDLHAVFDTDLLAWRCAWVGDLALRGIVFDGPHGTFPLIDGRPLFRLKARPGVMVDDGEDPRREPWGPIPTSHGRWTGLHLDGDDVVFEYTLDNGRHRVLERVWAQPHDGDFAFVREITIDTSDASITTGPLLRLLDSSEMRRTQVEGAGVVRAFTDRVTCQAPPNGTIRLAVVAPARAPAPRPEAASNTVHDTMARTRSRWGAPIITHGVIDDPLDEENGAERSFVRAAGAAASTVDLVAAEHGTLSLLRGDQPVASGPVDDVLVLREPSGLGTAPTLTDDDRIGWWPSDTGHGDFERNEYTSRNDLRLDGVTWRRGLVGRSLDFDGTAAAWLDDADLDLGAHDLTISAWIHTTSDGTVFAVAPPAGQWTPDGATLFVRNGRLCFDVGWVGVVNGGPRIDDGSWHHVAATWRHRDGRVRLYIDGERVASGALPFRNERDRSSDVGRFGWTSPNFPGVSRFSGYMEGPLLLRTAVDDDVILALARQTGEAIVEATLVRWDDPASTPRIAIEPDGRMARLALPSGRIDATAQVLHRRGPRSAVVAWARDIRATSPTERPFRIDRLTWPERSPYASWMRFGAFDFVPGTADAAVIATWSGDVWHVDGLDEDLDEIRWTRTATGLNQPFGVVVREDGPLVLGRDQITRLHDHNGDGEADFLENFTNSARNSEHFHEPASGLLEAPDGSLLYHKAARHAKHALHDHHGTVVRVAADGSTTEVVARGFRAPIGLAMLPDGSLLGSDQEGHWTPANRINLIRPSAQTPRFYGNSWAAQTEPRARIERNGEMVQPAWPDEAEMTPPLCWLHPTMDRSPSSHVWLDHEAWGPLNESILGLSYGTGEVYLVLRDDVRLENGATRTQGGVVKLGIQFPTGLLAGRVHPQTGDLYVCGLFGWSSDRTSPGGFYRVRPRPEGWRRTLNVPYRMRAVEDGLELTFLAPLDRASAADPANWSATAWNYLRRVDYGSKTYDLDGTANARTTWTVEHAETSPDGRTVRLRITDFEPAMQVHLKWAVRTADGVDLDHEAFLTIHATHGE